MAEYKYIPCDIYKRGVSLFVGSYDEMLSWAKKTYTEPEYNDFLTSMEESAPGGAADTHYDLGSCVVRVGKKPESEAEIAVLGHELLHAAFYIMDYCGLRYEMYHPNEHFTYLFEWLLRCALEDGQYEKVSDMEDQPDTSDNQPQEETISS